MNAMQFMGWVNYNREERNYTPTIDSLATYQNEMLATIAIAKTSLDFLISREGVNYRTLGMLLDFASSIDTRLQQIRDALHRSPLRTKQTSLYTSVAYRELNIDLSSKWLALYAEFNLDNIAKKSATIPATNKTPVWLQFINASIYGKKNPEAIIAPRLVS